MLSLMDVLKKLCAISSPSGYENEFAEKVAEIVKTLGLEYEKDAIGNLIVHRAGVGKRVLLDAHMDTTGLLAMYIDDNGFIRFDALGGLSPATLHNVAVRFKNGTRGVISYEQKTELKDRKISSMYIDIGASDETEARKNVLPGDAAVFDGELKELSGERISAPYLDNRIGCAILLYTLQRLKKCDYDIYAAFTVQEEVGGRGAKTSAYVTEADFAIVLDVTGASDTPGYDGSAGAKLSAGAGIRIMDKSAISHPAITAAIEKTAKEHGIRTQRFISQGGTDAGSVHLARSGIPTGGLSVPVRYIHSPCEVADFSDIKDCAELLYQVLEDNSIII